MVKTFLGNIHYLKENNFEITESLQEKISKFRKRSQYRFLFNHRWKSSCCFGFKDKIKENAKSAIQFYKIKALKL